MAQNRQTKFRDMSAEEIISLPKPTETEIAQTKQDIKNERRYQQIVKNQQAKENSNLLPDENAVYIHHALDAYDGYMPVNFNDPHDVAERTRMYFQACEDNNQRPSPPGLANYMGVTEDTLHSFFENPPGKSRSIAERTYSMLEQAWADYMMQNKVYPAVGIFLGKNWFHYADVRKVEVSATQNEEVDIERLQAEADALPDV